jgi:hypothetical protein
MHNFIVGPFNVDKNIINAHLQKEPYVVTLKYLHTHMSDSSGFQYRTLKISRFSLKVALLWETLATVQNLMLSGKYLVKMMTTTTTTTTTTTAMTTKNQQQQQQQQQQQHTLGWTLR